MTTNRRHALRRSAADVRGWSVVPRTRLYRRGVAGAAAAMLVSVALLAQTSVTSEATWNDAEWVNGGTVGSVSCDDAAGTFATRGEGRALSGSLLGIELDNVAEAKGVEATSNGERTKREPGTAAPADPAPYAFADPLDVEALNAVDVSLTRFLQLGLFSDPTGAVGQYGRAQQDGSAAGASGYVTSSGGINLDGNEGSYPELATVKLSNLLGDLGLDSLLADVTDLELNIGAVAGRAELNGCANAWDASAGVERQYLASHADLNLTSPTVSALSTTVSSTVGTLETTANGLVGDGNVLSGVVGGVVTLVEQVLSLPLVSNLLGLRAKPGASTAKVTALNLNLQPVRDLVDGPISDSDGVLSVSLAQGTVTIDTAALLAAAYPGENSRYADGLNNLTANTNPLRDGQVLTTLASRLSSLLSGPSGLIENVNQKLLEAVDTASIEIVVTIPIQSCAILCLTGWTDRGALGITVAGTLSDVIANRGNVTVDTSVLRSIPVLGPILNTLVSTLVSTLTGAVGGILGPVIDGALRPLAQLPADVVNTTVTPIVALIGSVYEGLFLEGLVSLTVNAQNGEPNEPHDWGPDSAKPLPPGQYDVAALRVGILDAAQSSAVWLYLGRASVGPGCSSTAAHQEGSPCAGY